MDEVSFIDFHYRVMKGLDRRISPLSFDESQELQYIVVHCE